MESLGPVVQFIAILIIWAGTLFSFVGVLGLIRLPDVYSRLHATGKVGVFAVALLVFAAIVVGSLDLWRGIILIAVLLVVGPSMTHAMGSAAYRLGIPLHEMSVRDDLERDIKDIDIFEAEGIADSAPET
ncbi:MAG: monovalent cation/H(+) antiporter subunit G [Chloroflexota bacterium]